MFARQSKTFLARQVKKKKGNKNQDIPEIQMKLTVGLFAVFL